MQITWLSKVKLSEKKALTSENDINMFLLTSLPNTKIEFQKDLYFIINLLFTFRVGVCPRLYSLAMCPYSLHVFNSHRQKKGKVTTNSISLSKFQSTDLKVTSLRANDIYLTCLFVLAHKSFCISSKHNTKPNDIKFGSTKTGPKKA